MYIFRADGNSIIGAGHIMRCLAIADTAKDMGETCLFIISSDELSDRIIRNGHRVHILNSDYSRMDPNEVLLPVKENEPAAVFIDSYFVTEEFMEEVHNGCRNYNCKLVYIDDRCATAFSCDVLLNYNISADIESYRKLYAGKQEPKMLIGTEYVPLRKEFQDSNERIISNEAKDVLVSTGGTDAEHLLLSLINEARNHIEFKFHFIVGMMNPDKELIRQISEGLSNIILYENVSRIDELMRRCDVAISASGSTLYELCATQTPTITYILADNQIPLAVCFDEQGVMLNCGDIRTLGNKALARSLTDSAIRLICDYNERVQYSNKMSAIVDGKGARRIIESILN